jgi:DNA-binding transcriptional LysR family regulator
MLNLPDLNRLKIFYAVYERKSLVKAAEAMAITRSAVSQRLKALEGELGTKLFIRNSKMVMATAAAHTLFRTTEPLLGELARAIRQMETGQTKPAGHLRVGAPQDFGSTKLTEAIVAFKRKFPDITFELALATPLRLLGLVSDGKLDLAFVDNGDLHAKSFPVSVAAVEREKFVLVCGKKYFDERVREAAPKLAELRKLEYVDYFPHAPVAKIWLKHHFGKAAPELRVSFSAESVRAVVGATLGGLGLAVVPERLVAAEIKEGRLLELHAGERILMNQIVIARRLERTATARESLFVDFYKSYAKQNP